MQEKDDALQIEKQEKNDAKKLKQQNLVVVKGRPDMKRARKKDLKPKKKNDEKPSVEIMDQMRYLGFKVYDQVPPLMPTTAISLITNASHLQPSYVPAIAPKPRPASITM